MMIKPINHQNSSERIQILTEYVVVTNSLALSCPVESDERLQYFFDLYKFTFRYKEVLIYNYELKVSFIKNYFINLLQRTEYAEFIPDMFKMYVVGSLPESLIKTYVDEYKNLNDDISRINYAIKYPRVLNNEDIFNYITTLIIHNITHNNEKDFWIEQTANFCHISLKHLT